MIKVAEIPEALGAMLGIELSPGEGGACQVIFDEDAVDFQVAEGRLFIAADLGRLPESEGGCAELLKANCFGAETLGATIGLDAERQVLTMHMMLAGAIEEEEFKELLAAFVEALRRWKAWTAAGGVAAAAGSHGTEALLPHMLAI